MNKVENKNSHIDVWRKEWSKDPECLPYILLVKKQKQKQWIYIFTKLF